MAGALYTIAIAIHLLIAVTFPHNTLLPPNRNARFQTSTRHGALTGELRKSFPTPSQTRSNPGHSLAPQVISDHASQGATVSAVLRTLSGGGAGCEQHTIAPGKLETFVGRRFAPTAPETSHSCQRSLSRRSREAANTPSVAQKAVMSSASVNRGDPGSMTSR